MKITKFENVVLDFVQKHMNVIFVLCMVLIALAVRYVFIPFESGDFIACLNGWLNLIRDYGGLGALKYSIGDYNVPYMFILSLMSYLPLSNLHIIKIISIVSDLLLACSVVLVSKELFAKVKNGKLFSMILFVVMLFLPTVLLNGSFWGQCDSLYSSFILFAVYFFFREKYIRTSIFLGVAFSFKLQTVFVLPAFLILYFATRKFSIFNFLIIPLVNFVLCLPAIIAGRPILEVLSIYFNQTQTYKTLTLNAANIYSFLDGPYSIIGKAGIALTVVLFGFLLLYVLYKKVKWNKNRVISLMLMSVLICNYFLPSMHERYIFLADILSVIWFACYRKKIYIPILLSFVSIRTYSVFLFGSSINLMYLSLIVGFVLLDFVLFFVKDIQSDDSGKIRLEKNKKIAKN